MAILKFSIRNPVAKQGNRKRQNSEIATFSQKHRHDDPFGALHHAAVRAYTIRAHTPNDCRSLRSLGRAHISLHLKAHEPKQLLGSNAEGLIFSGHDANFALGQWLLGADHANPADPGEEFFRHKADPQPGLGHRQNLVGRRGLRLGLKLQPESRKNCEYNS